MLAAGNSSRMGTAKQLLDFGGKPLVRHAAEIALRSVCRPVVVVCGAFADEIRGALAGLPIILVTNPEWQAGMGTSIQAGLGALPSDCAGALLILADQPRLTAEVYDNLVRMHEETRMPIVTAEYADTVGVPVFFAREYFEHLLALPADQGCKGVILKNEGRALRVPCPEAEADIDTPADYCRLNVGLC